MHFVRYSPRRAHSVLQVRRAPHPGRSPSSPRRLVSTYPHRVGQPSSVRTRGPSYSTHLRRWCCCCQHGSQFDIPGLLLVAFYQCSCMRLEDLLKPMQFGSSTEMLSQNDLAIALAGVTDLDELVSQLLGAFLNYMPNRGCDDRNSCRRSMRRLLPKLNTGGDVFSKKWLFEPQSSRPLLRGAGGARPAGKIYSRHSSNNEGGRGPSWAKFMV